MNASRLLLIAGWTLTAPKRPRINAMRQQQASLSLRFVPLPRKREHNFQAFEYKSRFAGRPPKLGYNSVRFPALAGLRGTVPIPL